VPPLRLEKRRNRRSQKYRSKALPSKPHLHRTSQPRQARANPVMSGRRQRSPLAELIYRKKKLGRARKLSWEWPLSYLWAELSITVGRNTKEPSASRCQFPRQQNRYRPLLSRQPQAAFRRLRRHLARHPRTPNLNLDRSPSPPRLRARMIMVMVMVMMKTILRTLLRRPRPSPQDRLRPPPGKHPDRIRLDQISLGRIRLDWTKPGRTKLDQTKLVPTKPNPTRLEPRKLDQVNQPHRPLWSREAQLRPYKPPGQRPTLPLPA
jgi:hypothetical protein